MATVLVGIAALIILVNLFYFFYNRSYRYSYFSSILFFKLFLVLSGLTVGFGVLYYALSMSQDVLLDSSSNPVNVDIWKALYFSGETIVSVGFGDYVPVGIARLFALLEAMMGILLPTTYFMRSLNKNENTES
ncbi:two pore domain potassium channel family protein [Filobacillus milosensis]|uniref:Two pore domain potassium channel family protein n=1 Tax=Filobacillus milosensis TaxID=94137 RepID=A0A4Y8IFQ1_9BACI|nr:ion channel [Filobacillus milosensis]TFB13904.1 two pore domain potassium channel family protein [Filobacillus milosensis]